MISRSKYLLVILFIISTNTFFTLSQVKLGGWRDHLPYYFGKIVVKANNKIYCATDYSLFYYNIDDNSINKLSKVNGLSDVKISYIAYSSVNDAVIVAYTNSNIDILQNNTTFNIPDIKNKINIPDKRINKINVIGDNAYLSTNFGIVVINLTKKEILDTYYPSINGSINPVYAVCESNNKLYVATNTGIFSADSNNKFLVKYNNWNRITDLPNFDNCFTDVVNFNNNLVVLFKPLLSLTGILYENSTSNWQSIDVGQNNKIQSINVSANKLLVSIETSAIEFNSQFKITTQVSVSSCKYALKDDQNAFWIAGEEGLYKYFNNEFTYYRPQGPKFADCFRVAAADGNVWVTAGGINDRWSPLYNNRGIFAMINDKWIHIYYMNTNELINTSDFCNILINPLNHSKVYSSSYYNSGLIEIENNKLSKVYNSTNSSIQSRNPYGVLLTQTYGIAVDKEGNLWTTNSNVKNPVSVLQKSNNKWISLNFDNTISTVANLGDIIATSWGHKWIYTNTPNGLFVFDDKGTLENEADDQYLKFAVREADNIPVSSEVRCMIEDLDGNIWIGTTEGPLVYYMANEVFTNPDFAAKKIKIPFVKGSEDADYLLKKERINAIKVDGANRKWIGTQNTGAYLMSPDGTIEIHSFNVDNSPILSNTILDIAIDNQTGEVFFATDKGLVSYKGNAIEAFDDFGKVYVYPNPVRPDYDGEITITGMAKDVNVKITDVVGNLVYETKSLGGKAFWNGKTLKGKRVSTGIYLVFCTNADGTKSKITKLMFIH